MLKWSFSFMLQKSGIIRHFFSTALTQYRLFFWRCYIRWRCIHVGMLCCVYGREVSALYFLEDRNSLRDKARRMKERGGWKKNWEMTCEARKRLQQVEKESKVGKMKLQVRVECLTEIAAASAELIWWPTRRREAFTLLIRHLSQTSIVLCVGYFETQPEFAPKPQRKSWLCCMFLVCSGSNWLITNNPGLVNTINMDSLSSVFIVWSFGYVTSCQVRGFGDDGGSLNKLGFPSPCLQLSILDLTFYFCGLNMKNDQYRKFWPSDDSLSTTSSIALWVVFCTALWKRIQQMQYLLVSLLCRFCKNKNAGKVGSNIWVVATCQEKLNVNKVREVCHHGFKFEK